MSSPFSDPCKQLMVMPNAARIILALSVVSLAFAFTMQYGFHYEPCILCLWQRVPFGITLLLSGLMFAPGLRKQVPVLLGLCALAFLIGANLAIFHTGVERHWWLGTSGCTITPLHGESIEDFRTQLLHTVTARCDEISWKFLRLSMANYNIVYSLALALFSLCAARKTAR